MGVYEDIRGQAPAWRSALAQLSAVRAPALSRPLTFTGCGASFHAATAAASAARTLGISAAAAPASELWLDPDSWLHADGTLVGLSRTGTTAETIQAMRAAAVRGVRTIGISLDATSPVVTDADTGYGLVDLGETARVMTRSVSSLLLASLWITIREAEAGHVMDALHSVPDHVDARIDSYDAVAAKVVMSSVSNVTFLGSGVAYGVARQAALQLQETSELAAAAYHPLEYRHGPMAALDEQSLVVQISTSPAAALDRILADDIALLGGTFVLCGDSRELAQFVGPGETVVTSGGVDPLLTPLASLPFLQLIGYYQTLAVGKSNEAVRNLDRTVEPHVNPHVLPPDLLEARP